MAVAEGQVRASLEQEARKGHAYGCEALYLDPGWDTDFDTFLWGESWLGPRRAFVEEMQSKYNLKLALHCPLATWMSHQYSWGLGAAKTWPPEEGAWVVNLFNLSDQPRTIQGQLALDTMKLDARKAYAASAPWVRVDNGLCQVSLTLPPWSAEVGEVQAK